MTVRRVCLLIAISSAAGLVAACSALPRATRVLAGSDVAAAIQRVAGVTMTADPGYPYSITLENVLSTYYGQSMRQRIAIIAFDNPRAVRQALGSGAVAPELGITVIQRDNIMVLYEHTPDTPDLRDRISSTLARAPARLTPAAG